MNLQNLILGVAVLAALVLGIMGVTRPIPPPQTGSVVGPDSSFACETHNGTTVCFGNTRFSTGSTTVASFRSPAATSTMTLGVARLSTGSTTATMFEWGRAYVMDATTTSLGQFFLPASAKGTMIASTTQGAFTGGTSATADVQYVIPPNTFVNLKYGNSVCTVGNTCNTFVGTVSVKFEY